MKNTHVTVKIKKYHIMLFALVVAALVFSFVLSGWSFNFRLSVSFFGIGMVGGFVSIFMDTLINFFPPILASALIAKEVFSKISIYIIAGVVLILPLFLSEHLNHVIINLNHMDLILAMVASAVVLSALVCAVLSVVSYKLLHKKGLAR